MKVLMAKAVVTEWRPARRFWNIFQVHDPADISPLTVRSALTAARYEAYYRDVRDAPVFTRLQLGEKLKIAAALGLAQLIRFHQPSDGPPCGEKLAAQLRKVMATPPAIFAILVTWPLIEGQIATTTAVEDAGPDARALLLCNYIAAAGSMWLERLQMDFETLTAAHDEGGPGSMFMGPDARPSVAGQQLQSRSTITARSPLNKSPR